VQQPPRSRGSGFADFDPSAGPLPAEFEVLGPGGFGGKARGLIYAGRLRDGGHPLAGPHSSRVRLPPSALVGTDLYDAMVERAGLGAAIADEGVPVPADPLGGVPFPEEARERFRDYLARHRVPLAVRSSSLLEDDPRHSFSGIYRTRFVANAGSDAERLRSFEEAVRAVLASTFLPRADAYRRRRGLERRGERMAVLVQHLVGRRRGDLFFPLVGGVAFSSNMYPWTDRVRVEDGVARLVAGLGTRAVDRDFARVFVPAHPGLRPDGFSVEAIERTAQEGLDAVDLATGAWRRGVPLREVVRAPANDLHLVSSLVREGEFLMAARFPLGEDERFVVTFDEVLADRTPLPLAAILRAMLDSLSRAFGTAVDVEFAAEGLGAPDGPPEPLFLLQVRPLGVREAHRGVSVDPGSHRVVLRSRRVLGNGERDDLAHVVLVRASEYRAARPDRVVREVARLNRALEGRPYLLVGPGRWGTSHPSLGVPAGYDALSGAAAIVEVASGEMATEVSYGTHFFGELLGQGTFFLAVLPGEDAVLDEEYLLAHASPPVDGVRLVTLPRPLVLQVDGPGRLGVAFVPDAP